MSDIPVKMRCDQMKVIDIYLEAAKEDESIKKFLSTLADKIQKGLEAMEQEGEE